MTPMRSLTRGASVRHDEGFSLIEALVAMVVFVATLSVISSAIVAMTKNVRQAEGVSLASDQARLGFNRMDKQVRYANAISTPFYVADQNAWYVELSVDDAKFDGKTDGVKDEACHQWRVMDNKLQTRNWTLKINSSGVEVKRETEWSTIATGVVNTSTQRPFEVAPATDDEIYQQMRLDLRTQRGADAQSRAQVKTTFFARNSQSKLPTDGICLQLGRN